jgi:hypothetical protein
VALDAKGRVVARVGEREAEFGDSLAGAEVVADALRGYLSDDVWGAGEKLRRLAAAPVLSKSRDRIVGALYVGAETGKRLAEVWKKNLGVDVAVLLRKQVLSSTVPESLLSELPALIESHKQEIAEAKRTRALPLPVGSDRLLVVGAPFAGQAGEQDAYYVLIGKKAAASNPWALLSSTTAEDLKWTSFPWLALGGGLLAVLGIGLFLQHYEVESPLLRLRKEIRRVADGDMHKIDDTRFHGRFGGIARDVNAAIERFTHSTASSRSDASRSDISRKDFNAILDSPPERQSAGFASPGFAPPPPSYAPPPPAFAPSPAAFAPPPPAFAPPPATFAPPPATFAPPPPPPTFPPPQPPTLGDPWKAPPPPAPIASPSPTLSRSTSMGMPRATSTLPIEVDESPQARRSFGAELEDDSTSPIPAEEPTRTIDKLDPEEAHIREVFADYVSARRETGESTSSLTLEKFRAKLEANRQQLITKYSCRTARFSVYIKDGKAAIKATPVRE